MPPSPAAWEDHKQKRTAMLDDLVARGGIAGYTAPTYPSMVWWVRPIATVKILELAGANAPRLVDLVDF